MINENEFKSQVAKNLVYYRKMSKLTQSELAKKLNYSDKAISKWERGENLPDVFILASIAEIYGVSLNDLASTSPKAPKITRQEIHRLITTLSTTLIWLIATVAYILMIIIDPSLKGAWLSFIYAIPVSLIILIVFSALWWGDLMLSIVVSLFSWSIPLAISLSTSIKSMWLLFICVIPFQILVILWFVLRYKVKKSNALKRQDEI